MPSVPTTRSTHLQFWRTIQGRLVLLLLLVLIPAMLVQAYSHYARHQTRRAMELESNLEVARATASNFEVFVKDIVHSELLIGLALTASQPITDQDRNRILDRFQADNPTVRAVLWVNPSGLTIASSQRTAIGSGVSDRAYFQQIVAGREWAVSELLLGKVTEEPTFVISRGIRSEKGEVLGVVAVSVASDRLDSVIRIERSQSAGVSLIDQKGMHVYRNPPTELRWEERNWLKMFPVMADALNGSEVTATVHWERTGKKRLVAFVPVPSLGWAAAASRDEEAAMASITAASVPQTILFVVVTLSTFCGALLLSRSISAPISQLRSQALQFGRGEGVFPTLHFGPSEVRELARAFREMAETVRTRGADLIASEEKFRTLFRSVPEALALTHSDEAAILEVNESFCRLVGLSREDVIDKTFAELGICSDPNERAQFLSILTFQDSVSDLVCRLETKSEDLKTVLLSTKAVDVRGRHGLLFILRDITEHKRAHEALHAASRYARSLIEASLDPLVTISPRGKITDVNAATEIVTGYDRNHLIGTDFSDYFTDPEDARAGYQTVFREGSVRDYPLEIQHANGAATSVLYNASVYRDEKGEIVGVFAAARDITERKRAEAERIDLERQIQKARKAESLARMAGAIAHHFNNKLMAVSGNLELALYCAGSDRKLATYLVEAQRASAQAAEVSSLMLAYLGQALPKAETLDLTEVCSEVIESLRASLPGRVSLKTDIPPHGPAIKANQAQMRQVLSSLLINAWEAIGEGEGEIRVGLRTAEATEVSLLHLIPADWKPEKATYACLEVSDTGCGISSEHLDLIFDPFFSTKFTGRGLGLPVALGAVRSYGGAIAVESEPGQGSVFRVFWPAVELRPQPVRQAQTEIPSPTIGSSLVLFVDDEAQLREMAEGMLEHSGFTVITARHGLEALEIFSKRIDEINLVILDLTMPGMNGWETMEALRELRPDIPVILSSGYDEAMVMEGAHPHLPQAFLHKPYGMVKLKAALIAALRSFPCEGIR